jgi:hypothetical protein
MSVRIKITAGGIYNAEGKEIEVGSELALKDEPTAWAGRYETISGGDTKAKKAVTNPAGGDTKAKKAVTNPAGGDTKALLKAEHHGGGKFNITKGEEVLLAGISKTDADAFNALSDEDKAAFVADQKPAA